MLDQLNRISFLPLTPSALLAAVLLSGCGSFLPIQSPEQAGAKAFQSSGQVRIVRTEETSALTLLGNVEGYSCKNKLWDPTATADAAMLQLQVAAFGQGATAVSEVSCSEGGFSLGANCWQSFTCSGKAYK